MKWLVLVLALGLAGCCNHGSSKTESKPTKVTQGLNALKVYEDLERGVTCYRVDQFEGLSCLKTKPSAKEEMENKMIQEIFKGE